MLRKAIVAVLVSAGIALCQRAPRHPAPAPEPPLKELVTINKATMTYYSWLKHVPTSIKQLGPPGGKVADANGADLITADLASGTQNGFSFALKGTKSGWTNQSHDAHEIKHATIHYRWHPFHGQAVRLLRARNKDGEQCIRCELPDGTTATLPGWMTDAETCTQMSAGEPIVDVLALAHLRSLLDTWFREHPYAARAGAITTSPGSPSTKKSSATESRWEAPE